MKYKAKKTTGLSADPETFQKVQNVFGGRSKNISGQELSSGSSTQRTPFTEKLLGKLNYEKAKITTLANGEKYIKIPAIKKDKYRLATLIAQKDKGLSNAKLIVAKPAKGFIKSAKEKGITRTKFEATYTGIIKAYNLEWKKSSWIERVHVQEWKIN